MGEFFGTTYYGCLARCGVAAPWGCGRESEEDAEVVDIDELRDLPAQIAGKELANESYEAMQTRVRELTHFPDDAPRLIQLVYLASLLPHQSPFSNMDVTIFARSLYSNRQTKNWLRFAFVVVFLFPALAWMLVNSDDPWLVGVVTYVLAAVGGVVSWIATGSNPDFKSDAANVRQDRLAKLPETLMQIGRQLVLLHRSQPSFAVRIARDLDLKQVQSQMLRDDAEARVGPDLISLEAAVCAVLNQPLPERTPVVFDVFVRLMSRSERGRRIRRPRALELQGAS